MASTEEMLKSLRIDRNNSGAKRKRRLWPWIVGLVLVAVIGYALFAGKPAIVVETFSAQSAAQAGPRSILDASGFVTPRRIATVSSKVTGKVAEVLIEEGQRVEEGQLLAKLETTEAQAQVDLLQSQLVSSQSQLAEALTLLDLAERNLARQQELHERALVATSTLDSARSDRDAKKARVNSVQKSVKVAQEQLDVAKIGLVNMEIRAPFAGVIVAKAAQPGEMISPVSAGGGFTRTGIGTIVDMDSLEVQVDVNEAYIGRVQSKMAVDAVLNAYPDWKIPGEVIAIIPTADRSKATVKVRIALNSKDPRIVPDMGVRVSFLESVEVAAANSANFWIPQKAVVERDGSQYVFLFDDGKAAQTEVNIAERQGSDALINSGLSDGQQVILTPADLVDGAAVVAKE